MHHRKRFSNMIRVPSTHNLGRFASIILGKLPCVKSETLASVDLVTLAFVNIVALAFGKYCRNKITIRV